MARGGRTGGRTGGGPRRRPTGGTSPRSGAKRSQCDHSRGLVRRARIDVQHPAPPLPQLVVHPTAVDAMETRVRALRELVAGRRIRAHAAEPLRGISTARIDESVKSHAVTRIVVAAPRTWIVCAVAPSSRAATRPRPVGGVPTAAQRSCAASQPPKTKPPGAGAARAPSARTGYGSTAAPSWRPPARCLQPRCSPRELTKRGG